MEIINANYKWEVQLELYHEDPDAQQDYAWGWIQQQNCEDEEMYLSRLKRYATILCEQNALVKIKKVRRGTYGLFTTAEYISKDDNLQGIVLRPAIVTDLPWYAKRNHKEDRINSVVMVYWVALGVTLCHNVNDLIAVSVGEA